MKAVRFDPYGDVDVLDVREVDAPVATPGRVVVEIRAAAVNPGDVYVREGLAEEAWALRARLSGRETDVPQWSWTFPAGQGSDLAGEVVAVGEGVARWRVGDHVLGWSAERAAQAELVAVAAADLVAKPAAMSWEVAGSMCVAPMAALASVEAVAPEPGETVVVSGAAGAVGIVAVQLARRLGAASARTAALFGDTPVVRIRAAPARRRYGERAARSAGAHRREHRRARAPRRDRRCEARRSMSRRGQPNPVPPRGGEVRGNA